MCDDHPNTRNDMPEQQRKSTGARERILIIGAGYAGLTLANLLLQEPNNKAPFFEVVVIDRLRAPPNGNVIHGTIRVPFAKHLLPQIKRLDSTKVQALLLQESQRDNGRDKLHETELLALLRETVSVYYQHEAQNITYRTITKGSSGGGDGGKVQLYVTIRKRTSVYGPCPKNDVISTWGPYDWVIAADGALSQFRNLPDRVSCQQVLLVGDAQWVHGHWWDLGRQRLHRGADLALQQAHKVATALLARHGQHPITHNHDTLLQDASILTEFRPKSSLDQWTRIVFCVLPVALLLLSHFFSSKKSTDNA